MDLSIPKQNAHAQFGGVAGLAVSRRLVQLLGESHAVLGLNKFSQREWRRMLASVLA